MSTTRPGDDPTPRAGEGGAYRKTPTQLATDPAFTSTYVQAVVGVASKYGLDPTGVANCSTGMQAWLNDIPDGGYGVLPSGTYFCSGLVPPVGRSITLDFQPGAVLVQAADDKILRFKGGWDANFGVTALVTDNRTVNAMLRDQTKLTLDSAPPWVEGDIVKVFADDPIPGRRFNDGVSESRSGEFATVYEVSGNTVWLMGKLREFYSTNIRAARMSSARIKVKGLAVETPDSGMATWQSYLVSFEACAKPIIDGFRVRQGCSAALQMRSCFGYLIRDLQARRLNNNPGGNQFGYAVFDNSCEEGIVESPHVMDVRHGWTDDVVPTAANTSSPTDYGSSRNATIRNGRAFGVSGAAWDTHHPGRNHTFIGCVSVFSECGHNLRGVGHRVIDSRADACRSGFQTMTELSASYSYGHEITNCVTTGALYEALNIYTNNGRDGRVSVTINGGSHSGRTRALSVSAAKAVLTGGVKLPTTAGGIPTDYVAQVSNGDIVVDDATLDISPATGGTGIVLLQVNDSASTITGRKLALVTGSNASRLASAAISGVTSNTGHVDLRDVTTDTPLALTTSNLDASSVITEAAMSPDTVRFAPLTVGEAVVAREQAAGGTLTLASGTLHLTYFTAVKTAKVTQVRTVTRGTAASGLTHGLIGLYSVDASGNLTLIASIADDTALWAATFTAYTRSFQAAATKTAGGHYALGILATGTTMPAFYCTATIGPEDTQDPRLTGTLAGQTSLPSSIAVGSVGAASGGRAYGVLL